VANRLVFNLNNNVERDFKILEMRLQGATFAVIGKQFRITNARVRDVVLRSAWMMRWYLLNVMDTPEGFYHGDDDLCEKSVVANDGLQLLDTPFYFFLSMDETRREPITADKRMRERPNLSVIRLEEVMNDKLYWLDKVHQLQEKIRLIKSGKLKLSWIGYGNVKE
jgi:hypothetical protein